MIFVVYELTRSRKRTSGDTKKNNDKEAQTNIETFMQEACLFLQDSQEELKDPFSRESPLNIDHYKSTLMHDLIKIAEKIFKTDEYLHELNLIFHAIEHSDQSQVDEAITQQKIAIVNTMSSRLTSFKQGITDYINKKHKNDDAYLANIDKFIAEVDTYLTSLVKAYEKPEFKNQMPFDAKAFQKGEESKLLSIAKDHFPPNPSFFTKMLYFIRNVLMMGLILPVVLHKVRKGTWFPEKSSKTYHLFHEELTAGQDSTPLELGFRLT